MEGNLPEGAKHMLVAFEGDKPVPIVVANMSTIQIRIVLQRLMDGMDAGRTTYSELEDD